jgi:hypothetical protein
MTHRQFREFMIDQMCRRLDHAPRATRRTEAPAFAGERDEVFVAAAVALHAHRAVFESPAAQVILEPIACGSVGIATGPDWTGGPFA